jgi:hypothetical protein
LLAKAIDIAGTGALIADSSIGTFGQFPIFFPILHKKIKDQKGEVL